MSGWGYLVAALAVLYFIGKAKSPKKRKSPKKSQITQYEKTVDEEAQAIVDRITTEGQIDKLEERRDNAELKIEDASTERGRESAQRKVDILEKTIDLAHEKALRYQFVHEPGLFSPAEKLENAFKIFPTSKIEATKELLGDAPEDWIELRYGDEPEEPPEYLRGLKKFRTIYNGDLPDTEKEKKLNDLVKSDSDLYETFFIDPKQIPILEQVKVEKLTSEGVPFAQRLYEMGCRTFEDCLKADPEDFAELKGIGPKKKEELMNFQKKYGEQHGA